MQKKNFLNFLPSNFRHEKLFLIEKNLLDLTKLSLLKDSELNQILVSYPLCTLNNLKKLRAIAIFNSSIKISPPEAYLLLHCGIGSVKSLSNVNPHDLIKKIGRLERKLGTKTETKINLSLLKSWILRAKNNLNNNKFG